MTIHHRDDRVTLHHGDALDVLRTLPDASVDSVCTDPPYGLEFMGKEWDAFGRDTRQPFRGEIQTPDNPYGRSTVRYGGASSYGGKHLDAMRAFGEWCELWAAECLRVLKPGGHLLAFGGTRTWHRLACAVEDAGFEVRDSIAWLYGSGFPKSLDVSKAIDKAAGALAHESVAFTVAGRTDKNLPNPITRDYRPPAPATDVAREWAGWGTALKPAFEPVVVARKPLVGTVAANVTTHGTGALNIDGCRIGTDAGWSYPNGAGGNGFHGGVGRAADGSRTEPVASTGGRWPANVILDSEMADVLDEQSGNRPGAVSNGSKTQEGHVGTDTFKIRERPQVPGYADQGGASRFFKVVEADERGAISPHFPRDFDPPFLYQAKAPKRERPVVDGVAHPTVKPLALMRWLVRLVTPPGGTVLEPFAGSGTTVEACLVEGFKIIAIEKGGEYLPLILARINRQTELPEAAELVRQPDAARAIAEQVAGQLDIFGEETA